MLAFRFALQASVAPSMSAWRERARKAEDLGYSALYVTDHFSAQFGSLLATTVAAEATATLHVGTLVLNNGLRNPVVLAKEIATLGLAAEGRVEVGLGAGWLSSDYEEAGIERERPAVRVDRLAESLAVLKALWSTGGSTFYGRYYQVRGARCDPRPEALPRVIVGGGSRRVLMLAAREADIVNVTVPAGSDAANNATSAHFDQCLAWVRTAAADCAGPVELQVTAFAVVIVSSRRAAERSAAMFGFTGEEALDLPILLIGTVDELCERLISHRERWGFSTIVVPGEAIEAFAPVVTRLRGT
jgi:probable F420-dependent oxidoreductase